MHAYLDIDTANRNHPQMIEHFKAETEGAEPVTVTLSHFNQYSGDLSRHRRIFLLVTICPAKRKREAVPEPKGALSLLLDRSYLSYRSATTHV